MANRSAPTASVAPASKSKAASKASPQAQPAADPAAPKTPRARKPATRKSAPATAFPYDERYHLVSEAAYFRAERRGFRPGNELDDWLEAEAEVAALLQAPGWH